MLKSFFKGVLLPFAFPSLAACSTASFPTVEKVDLPKFMGKWYVSAGRFTPLESDVTNAIEKYEYDAANDAIDIDFTYRKGSPDGKLKSIPQSGKVVPGTGNAHWKVSPLWPLKFDYLIIALANDYSWTAIGVPDQKYLWVMHRVPGASREEINKILDHLKSIGYRTDAIEYVPQVW